MVRKTDQNQIRVGVVGVGRGMSFAQGAPFVGMELVALCDTWEAKLHEAGRKLNVTTYTDYDQFLFHDMDAVVLANYFHQHAPFAVEALEAGLHVMSETMACGTPAEGVALARAVDKSGKIFLFAENYPYFAYNQEMRRLYQNDEVGEMPIRRRGVQPPLRFARIQSIIAGDEPLAQLDSVYLLLLSRACADYVHHRHPPGERECTVNPSIRKRHREIERPARGPRRHHPLSHGQQFGRPNYGTEDARTRGLVSDPRHTRTDGESTLWSPRLPTGDCTSRGICERAMRVRRFTHQTFPITLRTRDGQDMAAVISLQTIILPKPSARTQRPISMSIVGLRWRWLGFKHGGRV